MREGRDRARQTESFSLCANVAMCVLYGPWTLEDSYQHVSPSSCLRQGLCFQLFTASDARLADPWTFEDAAELPALLFQVRCEWSSFVMGLPGGVDAEKPPWASRTWKSMWNCF